MRITVHETTILNAIAKCHPVKSSYAKLAKETGKARNDVGEIVEGLKAIGYVNITPSNEVYLIKDGRKYLGLDVDKSTSVTNITSEVEIVTIAPIKQAEEVTNNEKQLLTEAETPEQEQKAKPECSVLLSIDALAEKLNKPTIEIANCGLKSQALAKLADLMADDIAELLLAIKSDLERVAA